MAITLVGKTTQTWSAVGSTSQGTPQVQVSPPAGIVADDVLVVVWFLPQNYVDGANPLSIVTAHGFAYPVYAQSGPSFLGDGEFENIDGFASTQTFIRRVESGDSSTYPFGVFGIASNDGVNIQTAGSIGWETLRGYVVCLAYRNVDFYSVVENKVNIQSAWHSSAAGLSGIQKIKTTKNNCMLLQIQSAVTEHSASGNTATITNDVTFAQQEAYSFPETLMVSDVDANPYEQNYFVAQLEISDFITTGKGEFDVNYNFSYQHLGKGGSTVIALIDKDHRLEDPPPSVGQPCVTGSGYIAWETDIINPLLTQLWVVSTDTNQLVLKEDIGETATCISANLNFNGIGACIGGEAFFLQEPISAPYSAVFRFKIDESNLVSPDCWYAALATNRQYTNGLWRVELKGLLEITIDDMVGDVPTLPTYAPVYPNKLNLFTGDEVTVTAGTKDEYQTWRTLLKRRFDLWADIVYGVGPDLVYGQGRPRDAGWLVVNYALERKRMKVVAEPYAIPPFVTKWWVDDDAATPAFLPTEREDLTALVPRRVVESQYDGNGDLITPEGGKAPIYESEPSHRFVFAGLAKPPLRIDSIPNHGSQYAVASIVQISAGSEGSTPKVQSTVVTGALPYKGRPK